MIALLIAVELVFLLIATRATVRKRCPVGRARCDELSTPLQVFSLVNMTLITHFGGQLASFAGIVSNTGNVCYVFIVAAQWLVMRRLGAGAGLMSAGVVFMGLVFLGCSTGVLGAMPWLSGDEMTHIYRIVWASSHRFTAASFVAFFIGQAALVWLYDRWEDRSIWWHYAAAMAVMQTIDSVIFFPIAFRDFSGSLSIMLGGWLVKVALGLLLMPALAWMAEE